MRRYRNSVTEASIVRDDEPGYTIVLDADELGCSPGEVPPEQVTLDVPSGDTVHLDRLAQVVDSEDNLLYWSYFNEGPDDPIQMKVWPC
jgi:hypothetical protein